MGQSHAPQLWLVVAIEPKKASQEQSHPLLSVSSRSKGIE